MRLETGTQKFGIRNPEPLWILSHEPRQYKKQTDIYLTISDLKTVQQTIL